MAGSRGGPPRPSARARAYSRLHEREVRLLDAERIVAHVREQLAKGTTSGNWETWARQFGRGYLLEQLAAAIEILAKLHQDASADVKAADAADERRYKRLAARTSSGARADDR